MRFNLLRTLSGERNDRAGFPPEASIFAPLFSILTLFALIEAFQNYYAFFKGPRSAAAFFGILASRLIYYCFFLFLAVVVRLLSTKIPLKRSNVLKWITINLVTVSVAFLVHQTVSFAADRLLEVGRLDVAFPKMLFDNPSIWWDIIAYCLLLLIFNLVDNRKMSRQNEIRCTEMEIELVKSQLHELRNKIHPQFLFNTLEAISSLLRSRKEKEANHLLTLLSDFLRTSVYDSQEEETILEREISFLDRYLAVEKIRLSNRVGWKKEIASEALMALVPSFVLQQILEELIYSRPLKKRSRLEIYVESHVHKDKLRVTIGFECGEAGQLDGEAADNAFDVARGRLWRLYGDACRFGVKQKGGEVLVEMEIPFEPRVGEVGTEQREFYIQEEA